MRLNLGCGHVPLEGYFNVDLYANEADMQGDVLRCNFQDVEEIVAFHLLEHLSRPDAELLLNRARKWMAPGGTLTVEVPDMRAIFEMGIGQGWEGYVYGAQEHAGEFHLWGYTVESLVALVEAAGWTVDYARTFHSREGQRLNMPCILVVAHV